MIIEREENRMEIKRGITLELSKRDLRDLERVANILSAITGEIFGFEKITNLAKKVEFSKDEIGNALYVLNSLSESKTWTCGESSEEV